jgi:hypothetical protein
VLSVGSLAASFLGLALIAGGLGLVPAPWANLEASFRLFAVLPIALVAASIPVLPGGIGTGHLAFAWVFSWVGLKNGAEVYHFYALHLAIVAAMGAAVGVGWKRK